MVLRRLHINKSNKNEMFSIVQPVLNAVALILLSVLSLGTSFAHRCSKRVQIKMLGCMSDVEIDFFFFFFFFQYIL